MHRARDFLDLAYIYNLCTFSMTWAITSRKTNGIGDVKAIIKLFVKGAVMTMKRSGKYKIVRRFVSNSLAVCLALASALMIQGKDVNASVQINDTYLEEGYYDNSFNKASADAYTVRYTGNALVLNGANINFNSSLSFRNPTTELQLIGNNQINTTSYGTNLADSGNDDTLKVTGNGASLNVTGAKGLYSSSNLTIDGTVDIKATGTRQAYGFGVSANKTLEITGGSDVYGTSSGDSGFGIGLDWPDYSGNDIKISGNGTHVTASGTDGSKAFNKQPIIDGDY